MSDAPDRTKHSMTGCLIVLIVLGAAALILPQLLPERSRGDGVHSPGLRQPAQYPDRWGADSRTDRVERRAVARENARRPVIAACEDVIRVRIGDIDDRFGASYDDLRHALEQAIDVWHVAWTGAELFEYDPAGDMPITFKYREELAREREAQQAYQRALEEYNREVTVYNERVREHDERVERWNRSPGRADDPHLRQMQSEARRLERENERLRRQQQDLERLSLRVRMPTIRSGEYHRTVTYAQHTGEVLGIDRRINIYQFDALDHLVLILAHELGHALGLDHLDDPAAVMHANPVLGDDRQVFLSESDLDALLEICQPGFPNRLRHGSLR